MLEDGEEEQEEEEEEEGEEGEGPDFDAYELDNDIAPSSVIALKGDDDTILQRLMNLPEKQIKGTHLNEDDTKRRLKKYREANESEQGDSSLLDFFEKRAKLDIYVEEIGLDFDGIGKIIEASKIYIERVRGGLMGSLEDLLTI